MTETSREGFVPRHLRGIDVEAQQHDRIGCQWHHIATEQTNPSRVDINGRLQKPRCDKPVWPGTGLRLCETHTRRVGYLNPQLFSLSRAKKHLAWREDEHLEYLRSEVDRLQILVRWQAKRLRGEDTPTTNARRKTAGTIYAVLSGFNVKVGWTGRNLQDRMREYPPSTTILVHFPGYRGDETRIKRKFAHLRTHGNEWFPYAPQVTEWVEQMVAEHGAPDPSITCGPAKYEVPRPYAQQPVVKPRYWTGKTA